MDAKHGRSGPLVFVTVRHEIAAPNGLALTEEHDIVYRAAPQPGEAAPPPQPAPGDAHFMRELVPDDVLLFRYSALTFNGHRIRYDRRWCEQARPGARVRRFRFTAVRPTFDTHAFRVAGRDDGPDGIALWAQDHEGALTLRAQAEIH